MKKILSLILGLSFLLTNLLSLSGCGESSSLIRYDIAHRVQNLDPQFATNETDQMVIHNIFEGLLRQEPDGEIVTALASEYRISEDECTYTFLLKPGAHWRSEQPVTAHDFVYAFRRIFNALSPSPYAQNYSSIRNANAILNEGINVLSLGVRAIDDYTLEFQLSEPDSSFLERLCHSSAMPCNQEFFEETRGKYGTTKAAVPSNGPFFLNLWDNEKLYLKKSASYYDESSVQTPGVYLWIGRDQPDENGEVTSLYDLLLAGSSDSCSVTYEQAETAKELGYNWKTSVDTVWALTVNPEHHQLSNENIRRSFFRSINRAELEGFLVGNMELCDRIIAPDISLYGQNYTSSTKADSDIYEPNEARDQWQSGLSEIGSLALDSMELLVPEGSEVPYLCGMLQQMWQRNLSAFVNIVALPKSELEARVAAGDYDLAIVPFTASSNTPYDVLSRFTSESPLNHWNYASENFDSLLHEASVAPEEDASRRAYVQAEELLYRDCVVFPLFQEISCILFAPNVTGIQIYPYGGMVRFQNAVAIR